MQVQIRYELKLGSRVSMRSTTDSNTALLLRHMVKLLGRFTASDIDKSLCHDANLTLITCIKLETPNDD